MINFSIILMKIKQAIRYKLCPLAKKYPSKKISNLQKTFCQFKCTFILKKFIEQEQSSKKRLICCFIQNKF